MFLISNRARLGVGEWEYRREWNPTPLGAERGGEEQDIMGSVNTNLTQDDFDIVAFEVFYDTYGCNGTE